jgi:hypothetical protein
MRIESGAAKTNSREKRIKARGDRIAWTSRRRRGRWFASASRVTAPDDTPDATVPTRLQNPLTAKPPGKRRNFALLLHGHRVVRLTCGPSLPGRGGTLCQLHSFHSFLDMWVYLEGWAHMPSAPPYALSFRPFLRICCHFILILVDDCDDLTTPGSGGAPILRPGRTRPPLHTLQPHGPLLYSPTSVFFLLPPADLRPPFSSSSSPVPPCPALQPPPPPVLHRPPGPL